MTEQGYMDNKGVRLVSAPAMRDNKGSSYPFPAAWKTRLYFHLGVEMI